MVTQAAGEQAVGVVLRARTGFRGLALLLLGAGDIGFGLFVRFSDRLEYTHFLVDVDRAGWLLWMGAGVFLLTGVLNHRPLLWWPNRPRPPFGTYDRWQFAAAMFLKSWWACEYARLAVLHDQWWVYGQGGFWLVIAALVFLMSAWPEPVKVVMPRLPLGPGSEAAGAVQRARDA